MLFFASQFVMADGNDDDNKKSPKTDAMLFGDVRSGEEHIPFATIKVKGTTIGTAADATGHFKMTDMPVGKSTVVASAIGYKPQEQEAVFEDGKAINLFFDLEKDVLGLEEVVVTADRNDKHRTEASVIVNTISPKMMETAQAVSLSEGLNFTPGVRMETDCQNCGFTQVRMNGMEGAYSQVLINSRPVFSGLAGVYGLEIIPANIIERVEIIRGGGSALYGSNAIAGTINLILQDPLYNSFSVGGNIGLVGVGVDGSGDAATDYNFTANTTYVSDDMKTGIAIYGFNRERDPFDANGDDFSEVSKLSNTTFGARAYHRFGYRNKVTIDFMNMKENRRGGNDFDKVEHMADIAESLRHNITSGGVTYEQFFRENDLWSVYVAGQEVLRNSYYGAEQSLSDYGYTEGHTYNIGTQYNARFASSSLIVGLEQNIDLLKDTKMGYPEYSVNDDGTDVDVTYEENTIAADQKSYTTGAFAQYEMNFNRLDVSLGGRFDHYKIVDDAEDSNGDTDGNVFSPRLTVKYDIVPSLQGRLSYSKGYRAPQVFDEDLHIASSASRQVIHENADDLTQETSHSYMASLDFNKQLGNVYVGFLVEGFYTDLEDAFVLDPVSVGTDSDGEDIYVDDDGTITYLRSNAEGGATVKGVNLELNVVPAKHLTLGAGLTIQSSEYEEPQEDFDETSFYRTPDTYGYVTLDWDATENLCLNLTGDYTGKMLVPYYETEALNESDPFFDVAAKISYDFDLGGNVSLRVFGGIKNIFNSYQDDFTSGVDRDPAYIYGPSLPRSINFGVKIGNFLK